MREDSGVHLEGERTNLVCNKFNPTVNQGRDSPNVFEERKWEASSLVTSRKGIEE